MKLSDIKKVGVIGAGVMGHGIAMNFALWGYPTILYARHETSLISALENIKRTGDLYIEEGMLTVQQVRNALKRITTTTSLTEVAAYSDFITESIVEKLEDKKDLFESLDKMCPTHTILASDTSSLMLSDIGRDCKRQDKLVITHYYSPPAIVPGVEVARSPKTSDETFNLTYDLMKKIKKIPVKVLKEKPGALLATIQLALGQQIEAMWAEGVASAEDIELGIKTTFGFRMPHESHMMHNDLSGFWNWPKETRVSMEGKRRIYDISDETLEKIKQRMAEGSPWFISKEKLKEALEKRDREYIKRLKDLYWNK